MRAKRGRVVVMVWEVEEEVVVVVEGGKQIGFEA